MVVVGLTGGIGCGKSTVARLLACRGAAVVDADQIAREVAAPGGSAYRALVDHFGPGLVGADGALDRAAIAARVFSDPAELAALNAITHPAIGAAILARLDSLAPPASAASAPPSLLPPVAEGGGPPVVLDIPLLGAVFRQLYRLSGVVVVDAPVEVAVGRLVEQRGMSYADAEARVRAQASREERRELADVVIDNAGSLAQLEASVDRLWTWIDGLGSAASSSG